MNKLTRSLTAVFSLFFIAAQPCLAQHSEDPATYEKEMALKYPGYFTINPASVKVTLLGISEEADMGYVKLQEQPRDLNGVLVSIESIVNIAQKVWKIVEANKPVVNIQTKYATAYPEGITAAAQLSSWSKPKTYSYGFYAENLFGMVMIDAKYKVSYSYNGNYKGKGKYLTGVAVIPTVADVGWSYTFTMAASVPDSTVTNVGTDADPVAALQMKLSWKMSTILKEVDGSSVYYVQGDGIFEEIASPFTKGKPEELRPVAAVLLNPDKVF
ncbi:MAG TPA: hypothetical protein PKI19_08950 [Elusimicrobiales bacterium]|nr:hypothetical protein [Elusimicrobiales bacterium]